MRLGRIFSNATGSVVDKAMNLAEKMDASDNPLVSRVGECFGVALFLGVLVADAAREEISHLPFTQEGRKLRAQRSKNKALCQEQERKENLFYQAMKEDLIPSLKGGAQEVGAAILSMPGGPRMLEEATDLVASVIRREQ